MTAAPAAPVLEVDLGPGVRAGFTTRAGGVSPAPWDCLNLGLAVGDDPDRVHANRARVAAWAGVPVAWGTQVHGTGVAVVDGPPVDPATVGECDALLTADGSVAVAVLVADCVPVLLADPQARVVAAVHAGRRGLLAGVLAAAVDRMVARGAEPGRLRAAVGPCIGGRHYEVPAEMADEAEAVLPGVRVRTEQGTAGLDLPAGAVTALRRAGVVDVTAAGWDTGADQRFFSHRRAQRAGTTTGRCAGVVRLLPG